MSEPDSVMTTTGLTRHGSEFVATAHGESSGFRDWPGCRLV